MHSRDSPGPAGAYAERPADSSDAARQTGAAHPAGTSADAAGTAQPAGATHAGHPAGPARAVDDDLSELFAALADPTRRAILDRLAGGEATVNEIAEPFDMTLQAVSKHLKVLERAGLVTRSRQAQYRPVRLEPTGFDPAARWLQDHRAMRLAQLDRLEHTIRSLGSTHPPESPTHSPRRKEP